MAAPVFTDSASQTYTLGTGGNYVHITLDVSAILAVTDGSEFADIGGIYYPDEGGDPTASAVLAFVDSEAPPGVYHATVSTTNDGGETDRTYTITVVAAPTTVGSRSQSVNAGGVGRMGRSGVANAS